jgi:hypothetical protein
MQTRGNEEEAQSTCLHCVELGEVLSCSNGSTGRAIQCVIPNDFSKSLGVAYLNENITGN